MFWLTNLFYYDLLLLFPTCRTIFISHFNLQVKTAPRILPLVSQYSLHTSTHHKFAPTEVRPSVSQSVFPKQRVLIFLLHSLSVLLFFLISLSSLLFLVYCVLSPSLSLLCTCLSAWRFLYLMCCLYLTFLYFVSPTSILPLCLYLSPVRITSESRQSSQHHQQLQLALCIMITVTLIALHAVGQYNSLSQHFVRALQQHAT